jgi:BirA family biotin operon repressor/biotin-[acetyl-CoA-carboxylase] ligase
MNTEEPKADWSWVEWNKTSSTNQLATEQVLGRWAAGRRADRLAIMAEEQTAGRGQHGRVWESPAGGLYLSLALEDVPAEWRERLALVMGLVVVEALGGAGVGGLAVRWPNDVLLKGKKVGGILCEGVAMGDRWAAVVGIGVNVRHVELSPQVRDTATSLEDAGVDLSREQVAKAIVEQWDLLTADPPALREIIRRLRPLDALARRRVRVVEGAAVTEGTAAGLDDSGRLLVQLSTGETAALERGIVTIL